MVHGKLYDFFEEKFGLELTDKELRQIYITVLAGFSPTQKPMVFKVFDTENNFIADVKDSKIVGYIQPNEVGLIMRSLERLVLGFPIKTEKYLIIPPTKTFLHERASDII